MKTFKLFLLLSLILSGISLFPVPASATDTEAQTRKTESFHGIKVCNGIDLYLNQGNSEKITVEADPDIIDDLVTVVEDGILKIYMKKDHIWRWRTTRKVYVTVKELDMLDASSGSDVESRTPLQMRVLKIEASSGSDIELEVNAGELYLKTSSGSDANIKGTTDFFKASSSSGSDLNAAELKTKVCEVSASSGSDMSVYVTERIKAKASTGADIRYKGNPQEKDIDESSGGDVYKR